jgi:hypothetical protein
MADIKVNDLVEKTALHKDDLLYLVDMENNIDKKVKYGTIRPYKVYTAFINQTGTNAPVSTILQNELGTIAWSRMDAGIYSGVPSWTQQPNKTILPKMGSYSGNDFVLSYSEDAHTISLLSIEGGSGVDDALINFPLEIRVYN